MSTLELKNKILELSKEASLLEEILNLIKLETTNEDVFETQEEHKADLEISLTQKKKGETIPNTIAKQSVEKGDLHI